MPQLFDFIVVDFHGNTPEDWKKRLHPLLSRVKKGGVIAIDNVTLYQIPEWRDETGVKWFLDQLPSNWRIERHTEFLPGIAVITNED
jgi:predicted O-methyltransferase YrrM